MSGENGTESERVATQSEDGMIRDKTANGAKKENYRV